MVTSVKDILIKYKEEIPAIEQSNLSDFKNVEQGIVISRQYIKTITSAT